MNWVSKAINKITKKVARKVQKATLKVPLNIVVVTKMLTSIKQQPQLTWLLGVISYLVMLAYIHKPRNALITIKVTLITEKSSLPEQM